MKQFLLLPLFIFSVNRIHAQITWNNAFNVAPSSSGNEHPRVVTNAAGNPLVIWHHVSRVMYSRWNGTAFTTPVLLNPPTLKAAGASWMGPDIAAHGDTVYVVFKQVPEDSDTCHIYCVHSYDGGVSFSAPVRVDFIADSLSRFPAVTTDAIGNPVVGFMKFDHNFAQSRWAVARSNDFGNTFTVDVKASGWSDENSTVCDCCPGTLAQSGDKLALVYRDNNSDVRDCWAGISSDNGASFADGIGVDQQGWLINACPASGPDAAIIGDTLYSCYMSGAGGITRVYYSKTSLTDMQGSQAIRLSGNLTGLGLQNYPCLAVSGRALGIVWKQTVNGADQCVLRFTNDVNNGLPATLDILDQNNVTNCHIALFHGKIFVVWEDDNSGTIQYRSGAYQEASAVQNPATGPVLSMFPNPTRSSVHLESAESMESVQVFDFSGRVVYQARPDNNRFDFTPERAGIYLVKINTSKGTSTAKLGVVH